MYAILEGIKYTVILDRNETNVLGIVVGDQLCPFVAPNPKNPVKRGVPPVYDVVAVKLRRNKAKTIIPVDTRINMFEQFKDVDSLEPWTRMAIKPITVPRFPI